MSRVAEPRWNRRRNRWYANIGPPDENGRAREVMAPATIGEHAKADAWAWMVAERDRYDRPAKPEAPEPDPVDVEPLDTPPALDVPIMPEVRNWKLPRGWTLARGETVESALSAYLAMERKRSRAAP